MKVKVDTIARTAVLILALVNQCLAICGKQVLPFGEDEVYQICTVILTACAAAVAWWKNNSFTKNAIKADEMLEAMKKNAEEK